MPSPVPLTVYILAHFVDDKERPSATPPFFGTMKRRSKRVFDGNIHYTYILIVFAVSIVTVILLIPYP